LSQRPSPRFRAWSFATSLSRVVVRNLLLAKIRLALMLVILGATTAAIGLTMWIPVADRPPTTDAPPNTASEHAIDSQAPVTSKSTEQTKGESVVIHGQVLDPDGKLVAGARIVLTISTGLRLAYSQHLTLTGKNGRFETTRLEPGR
jgi:hypothetical protein